VLLAQVPASGAYDDGRGVVSEPVGLAVRVGERERPADRVPQVELALDQVLPQRGVGVLEVGQPHLRAGVERVDRHLRVGGAGDLDPPVDQAGGRRRHLPVGFAHRAGLLQEAQVGAGGDRGVPRSTGVEERPPPGLELPVQRGEEVERLRGQDLVEAGVQRPGDLDGVPDRLLRRHDDLSTMWKYASTI
jgi:hypothetical protein